VGLLGMGDKFSLMQ